MTYFKTIDKWIFSQLCQYYRNGQRCQYFSTQSNHFYQMNCNSLTLDYWRLNGSKDSIQSLTECYSNKNDPSYKATRYIEFPSPNTDDVLVYYIYTQLEKFIIHHFIQPKTDSSDLAGESQKLLVWETDSLGTVLDKAKEHYQTTYDQSKPSKLPSHHALSLKDQIQRFNQTH